MYVFKCLYIPINAILLHLFWGSVQAFGPDLAKVGLAGTWRPRLAEDEQHEEATVSRMCGQIRKGHLETLLTQGMGQDRITSVRDNGSSPMQRRPPLLMAGPYVDKSGM